MKRTSSVLAVALTLFAAHTVAAQTARNSATTLTAMTGFGAAIAATDSEVFVGRPGEFGMFPMPPSRPGGVHVFRPNAQGEWTETAVISSSDTEVGDAFGQAVAVAGNTLVVSAPKEDSTRGAVYVFARSGESEWNQVARLEAADRAQNDAFGQALAVSSDMILAGAPGHNGLRGAVYVFRPDANGTWTEHGKIVPSTIDSNDMFGAAISLEDNIALVGAPGPFAFSLFDGGPQPQPGAAYVYHRNVAGDWNEHAKLTSDSVLSLGFAVTLSGHFAFVSAPITGQASGAVVAFRRDSVDRWNELATISPKQRAPGSMFGFTVVRAGLDVLVGAPLAAGRKGIVQAFGWDDAARTWSEKQQLSAQITGLLGFFGGAMAIRGEQLIIGAPGADFFEGVGFAFERDATTGEWTELSSIVNEVPGLQPVVGGQVDCEDGTANRFDCAEVDLVSFLPVESLGAKRGIGVNDLWGWTDPETGTEYAIVGRSDATVFIDLGDPMNPVYVGELPLTDGANINIWRDMKVYKDHVFIVADGAGAHGIQVFDLNQLRAVRNSPVTFSETAHYDGIHSAHNIVINEGTGYAFAAGSSMGGETCGGGLHMINIQEPAQPTFAGCFSDPATGNARTGYSHDAQCIVYHGPDEEHSGKEICFGSNETALSISDVTNKEDPVALSSASYPSVAYAHQGWVSDDHRYFFMDDEGDELTGATPRTRTMVWDIEDLDDPVLLTEFLGSTAASDHNLYVRGRYMYQSNYVAGLRIIDIADPANPVEVGHFDTVPLGENIAGFAGSWSNYPFFASGIIVVTSMKEGVFVLKKKDTQLVP